MRGMLGVLLAGVLAGCGGVVTESGAEVEAMAPARADALGSEGAPTSDYTTLPYCYQIDALACGSIGSKRNCTDGAGGTFTCICSTGEWDCPPYDEPLAGK
ncbi:hypothetical protein NR798_46575 [Archangium gephyra]|uniref:hypothetical protein n=1 Tax=Archangium gephyra TaxID=48 RepID=UPI0035D487F3